MLYKKIDTPLAFINNGFTGNEDLVRARSPNSQILGCSVIANKDVFSSLLYIRFCSLFAWDKCAYPTSKDPYIL